MLQQADVAFEVQDLMVLQYFFTLMKTLMAPVKSAESSTSVWSVFRAPVRRGKEGGGLVVVGGGAALRVNQEQGTVVSFSQQWQKPDLPEGMVSESVESRLLHSASGFSAPISCGTMRAGCGANTADVTTALCAEEQEAGAGSGSIDPLQTNKVYLIHDATLDQEGGKLLNLYGHNWFKTVTKGGGGGCWSSGTRWMEGFGEPNPPLEKTCCFNVLSK